MKRWAVILLLLLVVVFQHETVSQLEARLESKQDECKIGDVAESSFRKVVVFVSSYF